MGNRWIAGIVLFAGAFLLYVATFSSVPTADGNWYIANIERRDYEWVLYAVSPLTGYLFFTFKRLATSLGFAIGTLALTQTVNAAVAAVGVVLFHGTVRLLGGTMVHGVVGAALLATSFGYWYYTNGEYQHLSLVTLLLIFYLLVRARVRGAAWGWRFAAGLGLLNAVAVMLRQESFLFGFAAVALLAIGRPWREGLKDGLIYAVAGSLATGILVFLVGHFLLGASSLDQILHWYLYMFYYVKVPREYQEFAFYMPFDVPRVVKGQLTALVFGTQTLTDTVRDWTLVRHPKVVVFLALTGVAYGAMAALAAELWSARAMICRRYLAPAVACLVWVLTYKILIHAWFWSTTKYHLITVPPIVLLLMLGPITGQAAGGSSAPRWRQPQWAMAALLAAVLVINFWGAILPWYRYGRMMEALAIRQATAFRPDDLFISSESGIDRIFWRGGNYIEIKGLFMRGAQSPRKREGFDAIRAAIEGQLARNGRVFVYSFVPTPFTLIGINQHFDIYRGPAWRSERLTARDFEELFEALRRTYVVRPVFSYWEESKAPLYIFGEIQAPFWEVTVRPPS